MTEADIVKNLKSYVPFVDEIAALFSGFNMRVNTRSLVADLITSIYLIQGDTFAKSIEYVEAAFYDEAHRSMKTIEQVLYTAKIFMAGYCTHSEVSGSLRPETMLEKLKALHIMHHEIEGIIVWLKKQMHTEKIPE